MSSMEHRCTRCGRMAMDFIRPPVTGSGHWELRADGTPFALANEEIGIDRCLDSLRSDPNVWRPSGRITKVHVVRGEDATVEEVGI